MAAAAPLATLAGCSVHPIPDDVGPRLPTEEIVRSVRCEMKLGLVDELNDILGTNVDPYILLTRAGRHAAISKTPPPEYAAFLDDYGKVGVAYDFDFEITEHNHAEAGVGFKIPFTAPAAIDLGATASLNKIRTGKRTFSSQETFGDMLAGDDLCKSFKVRDKNLLYPLTGSVGLRTVMRTFIALSKQGGGKESFIDALSFTTTVSGSINPTVKLNPVANSFRLVSATGNLAADRTDLHKVKVSLSFPKDGPPKRKDGIIVKEDPDGPKTAPYAYNPVWRARYGICVADARDREDAFKKLRHSPPEVYCIKYADTFVPRMAGDPPPPRISGYGGGERHYYGYEERDYDRDQPEERRRDFRPRKRQQPRVWWW